MRAFAVAVMFARSLSGGDAVAQQCLQVEERGFDCGRGSELGFHKGQPVMVIIIACTISRLKRTR